MRRILIHLHAWGPLALVAITLVVVLLVQRSLQDGIAQLRPIKPPRIEVNMETPEGIYLSKTWESADCGTVLVRTCFQSEGHESETEEAFKARHLARIATMKKLCPCPDDD